MPGLVLLSPSPGENKSLVLEPVWGWRLEMKVVTEWLCDEVEMVVDVRVEVMVEVELVVQVRVEVEVLVTESPRL